jgi:hypothetical protein
MKVDEKIKERLEAVVRLGQQALAVEHRSANSDRPYDHTLTAQWCASARSLLAGVFGTDSQYFAQFVEHTSQSLRLYYAQQGHGVVLAAQADYLAGGVLKVRQLVEAEVFDDFLEQAVALLGAGYRGPAAVVAGCVLEDALRKLCERHQITLPAKPKFDDTNQALRAKQVYDQATWRMLQALYDVRNLAAHHPEKWSELTQQKVADMIDFARKFLADHGG